MPRAISRAIGKARCRRKRLCAPSSELPKTDKGWSAKWYSIDQGAQPISVSSVSVDGATIKMGIEMIGGAFEGTLRPGRSHDRGNLDAGSNTFAAHAGPRDQRDSLGDSRRPHHRRS